VFGSKEWEGRRGTFMEGRGGQYKLFVWFKRVKGRNFNYRYVWFTKGGEVF
jgi:hypothetical protein